MKQQNFSFLGADILAQAERAKNSGNQHLTFNWDMAAEIIRKYLVDHPDLTAEAGLQGDWSYTGGEIFENGRPTNDSYTYLSSNWAIPTLILSWGGEDQEEINCSVIESESRFSSDSKWDDDSLKLLGINLK